MNKNAKAWLEALESDRYEQGYDFLHITYDSGKPDTFCCIGVACDLAKTAGLNLNVEKISLGGNINSVTYNGMDGHFPKSISNWLELNVEPIDENNFDGTFPGIPTSLVYMNDTQKLSFKEIAQIIRDNAEKIFKNEDSTS
jgi:hypothetical protein